MKGRMGNSEGMSTTGINTLGQDAFFYTARPWSCMQDNEPTQQAHQNRSRRTPDVAKSTYTTGSTGRRKSGNPRGMITGPGLALAKTHGKDGKQAPWRRFISGWRRARRIYGGGLQQTIESQPHLDHLCCQLRKEVSRDFAFLCWLVVCI